MLGLLTKILSPSTARVVAKHLRKCAQALPAAQVWNRLPSGERREILRHAMQQGAGGWVAGLATYEFLRQRFGFSLPALETMDRDALSMYLETAAAGLEEFVPARASTSAPDIDVSFVDDEDDLPPTPRGR